MNCFIGRLVHGGVAASWLLLVLWPLSVPAADAAKRPNIVFILMDDMGWRDVGFMGNSFVETPHLDRLVRQGIVFTQSYSTAPNCAPTRACLMSGQYTPRHGIYTVVDPRQPPGSAWHKLLAAESKSELDPQVETIAEALRRGGYATAFFGMWNLGRGRTGPVTPGGQGFQKVVFPENLGFAKDAYFNSQGEYLSDRLMDEVLAFIHQHRTDPFFVYLPDHAVHAPYEPKAELLKKYELKAAKGNDRRNDPANAATIEAVDQNVGRLWEKLVEWELADNTFFVFTSDNGGVDRYTAPLRGGKGQLYEGGIRVPLLVVWSGIAKPGTRSDTPVSSVDWFPTFLDLTKLDAPHNQTLDGVSLMPVFRGEEFSARAPLFWHFPCYVGKATPASAIREGNHKLIEFFENGGRVELYDLAKDPNEEHDLADERPAEASRLHQQLMRWQAATQAAKPRGLNPAYDPKADRPRGAPQGDSPQRPSTQRSTPKRRN
jgi:arylsulfatase A